MQDLLSAARSSRQGRTDPLLGEMLLGFGDAAPFVRSLELIPGEGEPLGYPRVRSLFESLGGKPPEEVIAGLAAAADGWAGGLAPKDDMTLVVIRMRAG